MRAATTAPVAVVAWLGYLPPPGVGPGAATAGHARAGARDLAAFVPAYLAGRQVTLVGHSYGALVVGLAAPRLPQVRDVVLLGAPGAGHDRAADLGGARVWAALSADDWVRRIPQLRLGPLGHGRRPTAPRFGATGLPTDGRVRARQLPGGRRGDPGRRRSRCSRNRGRRNRGRRNRGRRDRGRRAPATACRARAPGGAVVA
jgi:pimeloyl-ACP methyl ester carboxylesterase